MKIAIVGYGNLGWNLDKQLHKVGVKVSQIVSANKKESHFLSSTHFIDPKTDLIFICKSDSTISQTVNELNKSTLHDACIVTHTSGSVHIQDSRFQNAVFYPFQTFTQHYYADWREVPIFIEADNDETQSVLFEIASQLGGIAHDLNSEYRKKLHIAGVFSSNFSNHMLRLMFDYLEENKLDPLIIKPLFKEAIKKSFELGPSKAQTGPAFRGDDKIVQDHLKLLQNNPELHALYKQFTEGILNAKR